MFDHICLYNSKVFVPLLEERGAFVVSFAHYLNSKQNFEELFRLKVPLKSFFKSKYILLDATDNYVFGLKCLIVLVFGLSNDLHVFMYCEAISNNLLSVLYLNPVPNKIRRNIFLTNGPTLSTFFGGTLCFYSLCYKTNSSLNLSSIFSANDSIILQALCVGQILKDKQLNIILIILSGHIDSKQDISIYALGVDFRKNTTVIYQKLCTSYFFNQSLISIAKAVEVCNLFSLDHSIKQIEEISWRENYTVVCTQTKCFIYLKSDLKYIFDLLFQSVDLIKIEINYISSEIFNLIILGEKKVCLYKPKKDSMELQAMKTWLGIQSLHIDDILLNGKKQMILLKDCQFEKWHDNFMLIDVSSITPVDIQNQPAIPDECLEVTLSGLNMKYQAGKLASAIKEYEINNKIEATLDALNKLNNFDSAETNVVSSFQESLVDILLSKNENCEAKTNKRNKKKLLKLENHWSKFINKKWFLCWTFSNEDDSPICYSSVRIFTPDQEVMNYQKSFIYDSRKMSTKHIKPGQRFSVVSTIEFPYFYAKNISISAIISWYSGSISEFENELFLPIEEKQLVQNQLSFSIHLNTEDMFLNVPQDISIDELLCMKVLYQRVIFTVSSIHSNLYNIENMLLSSNFGATQLISIKISAFDVIVFNNSISPLYGTHFMFRHVEKNTAEMEVFIENEKQLLLLLQFLKQCLTDDIVFHPIAKTADEVKNLLQKMVCAMKEETDLLVTAFNIHHISAQIQDHLETPLQVGTIVIPRNTYLRIRKTLVKKECITDNILQQIYSTIK